MKPSNKICFVYLIEQPVFQGGSITCGSLLYYSDGSKPSTTECHWFCLHGILLDCLGRTAAQCSRDSARVLRALMGSEMSWQKMPQNRQTGLVLNEHCLVCQSSLSDIFTSIQSYLHVCVGQLIVRRWHEG